MLGLHHKCVKRAGLPLVDLQMTAQFYRDRAEVALKFDVEMPRRLRDHKHLPGQKRRQNIGLLQRRDAQPARRPDGDFP